MGVDEGNLQVIDVVLDVMLENCPITTVTLNLLVYNSFLKYSTLTLLVLSV